MKGLMTVLTSHGLIIISSYIFKLQHNSYFRRAFFNVKKDFLAVTMCTVFLPRAGLLAFLLNYSNSSETNCIIKASEEYLRIVLHKLRK